MIRTRTAAEVISSLHWGFVLVQLKEVYPEQGGQFWTQIQMGPDGLLGMGKLIGDETLDRGVSVC